MKEVKFPDGSYSILCRNAGNQKCLEGCVLEGKGRWFERDRRITLDWVPTGETDHLDPKLQFKIHKAKVDIIIDHLRGEGTIYEAIDFIQGRNQGVPNDQSKESLKRSEEGRSPQRA